MKKIAAIALGILTFVPSAFADTSQNDVYQCEAVLEEARASIRSKFVFDGDAGGTSFNYIQSYYIRVYRQIGEDSPRIYFTANGSISGFLGYIGYPIYQNRAQSPMSVTFNILAFSSTLKITCVREMNLTI